MRRPGFTRRARTAVTMAAIIASFGIADLSLPGPARAQGQPAPATPPPPATPIPTAPDTARAIPTTPLLAPVTTPVAPATPAAPGAAATPGAAAAPETTAARAATPAPASTTSIPASLDIGAEVRYRLEIDGRDKIIPNSSTTERSFLRARLSVNAALPKNVSVFLEAQDARVFGEEPSPESGTGSTKDLHQGYILAEDFITPGLWLRLGRMELIYGNERLVGANDFTNTGRAFDGAVVGYRGEQFDLEVFETKIGESVGSAFRGRDYDFFGTYASIRALALHTVDLFAFYDRDVDTLATGEDALKRLTIGGRVAGAQSALSYEVEGGAQTGDQGSSSISAAYFGGRVSYKLSGAYEPQITAGADWLSGDDDSTDTDFKAFNTLYATNHKFYGNMDLFIDLPEDTQNLGLFDLLLGVSGKPTKWLDARVFYHNFQSAEDFVSNANGGSGLSSFGNEIDLIGEIPCTENLTVETAFSYFSPGEIIEPLVLQRTGVAGAPEDAYLFYLQVRVDF